MISKIRKFFVLMIIFSLFSACDFLQKDKKLLLQEKEKFISAIEEDSEYIKNISKVLAFDSDILKVYKELKERVSNFEKIAENKEILEKYGHKLKDIFNEIIRKYERDIGLPVKYKFYLPSGVLWLIPDKPYGEDIILQKSSHESSNITEAINKAKIISGIVVENNGLLFSSATPIQSETGEILGVVEVWTDFVYILEHYLYKNPKAKIMVILKRDFQKFFKDILPDKSTDKGFVLYTNLEKADYPSVINKAIAMEKDSIIKINNKSFIVIPLFDFTNKEIGKILFSTT
ncbi:MAG: hypothetical protein ACPLW7_05350 [Minisyncoccia bacterium]